MFGGTWLVVPCLQSCASTLGIRLEPPFIQIVANGSSEPILPIFCFTPNNCHAA